MCRSRWAPPLCWLGSHQHFFKIMVPWLGDSKQCYPKHLKYLMELDLGEVEW